IRTQVLQSIDGGLFPRKSVAPIGASKDKPLRSINPIPNIEQDNLPQSSGGTEPNDNIQHPILPPHTTRRSSQQIILPSYINEYQGYISLMGTFTNFVIHLKRAQEAMTLTLYLTEP
ncbi:unnamed protein product, partial [Sphenostylis stenocarpa]